MEFGVLAPNFGGDSLGMHFDFGAPFDGADQSPEVCHSPPASFGRTQSGSLLANF